MDEPRTHYQISLTARQAIGLFVGLLAALVVAYYFGVRTGLAGRDRPAQEAPAPAADASPADPLALPPIETAVPTAAASLGSRTELAGGAFVATPLPAESPAPAELSSFDDGSSADEASPLAEASPGKAPPPSGPGTGTGKYWVQVASLSSRDEAGALSTRLSRRGFPSQLLTASGLPGKGLVYRVRIGPYPSEAEAGRVADRLVREEKLKGPWVVPDGK